MAAGVAHRPEGGTTPHQPSSPPSQPSENGSIWFHSSGWRSVGLYCFRASSYHISATIRAAILGSTFFPLWCENRIPLSVFFSFFFSGQSMECTLLFLLFRTIFLFYLFHPSLMALLDYLGLRKHHYRVKVANEVLHNRKIKTSEKKSAKLPGRSPNLAMSNLNLTPNANCKAIRTATFESFPTGCHEESWSWWNTVTAHPFCLVKCNRAWSREGRHSHIARTDIKSRRNPTGFGDVLVMNAGGTICRWGLFWKWTVG